MLDGVFHSTVFKVGNFYVLCGHYVIVNETMARIA